MIPGLERLCIQLGYNEPSKMGAIDIVVKDSKKWQNCILGLYYPFWKQIHFQTADGISSVQQQEQKLLPQGDIFHHETKFCFSSEQPSY